MSDQHGTTSDRSAVARSRKSSTNRLGVDRWRRQLDLLCGALVVAWLSGAGCVAVHAPIPAPAPRVEVWVDAYAAAGGDGTPSRPFKTLPPSLARGATVHLASGVYRAPFALPDEVELIGTGVVVLSLEGAGQVVTATNGRLVNLSIQGGETGLVARARVTLEGVTFSGFARVGLSAEPGASVSCTRCRLEGTIAGAIGVVASGASVRVVQGEFSGGLARGLEVQNSEVSLERTASAGPRTLLRATDAQVHLVDVKSEAGSASAFVIGGGSLDARAVTVVGHDSALQVARANVSVDGLSTIGALCGVSLQHVKGSLARVRVERSGLQGAVVLLDCDVSFSDLEVRDAHAWGVLVRKGRVQLKNVRVSQVAREGGTPADPDLGDGLQLRDAQVSLEDVQVQDTEGSALYASHFARVSLRNLVAERVGAGAVVIDVSAELDAGSVTLRGAHGPGVLLMNRGHALIERLDASGVDVATWTDCETGASVEVRHLVSAVAPIPSRCEKIGR